VLTVAAITRRHVEDDKPWLAARPGQKAPRLTTATIAHRLGTLRMFFIRIDEWRWEDAPGRIPIVAGDLPRQDHPLPKALDDGAAAKFLRAATTQRRLLVRVVCEVLIRTGLRVSELIGLQADAIVQIGVGRWLHVPVGRLHDDRYLPLHPHLVDLIGDYRSQHVSPHNSLLLPRENGRPIDRHRVTRYLNKAAADAGIGHVHPHQMRHTLATQAINRGMSLEAIAAMLGHHSMDTTLRYAKIANRTVADEYFAVTEKVEALYGQQTPLPADTIGANMAGCGASISGCSATATAHDPPSWTAPSKPSARTAHSSKPASSSGRSCKPNTTTPRPRTKPAASSSSASCSPTCTKTHHDPYCKALTRITHIMPSWVRAGRQDAALC